MSLSLVRHLTRRATASRSPSVNHVVLRPCIHCSPLSRTYASKAKSTASFVPGSQVLFDSEEARTEYAKAEVKMTTAVDWFRKEVASFETRATGRITPAILSPVRVKTHPSSKGVKLEELATVGVKDGSTLIVTLFDEYDMKATEQAIYDAKIPNIVPQKTDSRTIRIPIPKPTVEARTSLVNTADRIAEDVRCQIRKTHQACTKKGKYAKHSIELEEFQKLTDKHIAEVNKIFAQMKKTAGTK